MTTEPKPIAPTLATMVSNEKELRQRDRGAFEKHGHFVMFVNDVIVGWQFSLSAYQAMMISFPSHKGHFSEKYKALDFRICRHEQIKEAELVGKCGRKREYDDTAIELINRIKELRSKMQSQAYELRSLREGIAAQKKQYDESIASLEALNRKLLDSLNRKKGKRT